MFKNLNVLYTYVTFEELGSSIKTGIYHPAFTLVSSVSKMSKHALTPNRLSVEHYQLHQRCAFALSAALSATISNS
jgi:hypothetical protein